MIIEVEVPKYSKETGIKYSWEDGFEIETSCDRQAIRIVANREGLLSLANHLLNLAQEGVPSGHHMHFDEYNSLENGSRELIIERR